MLQLADLIGARGLDWLLVTANIALGLGWLDRKRRKGRASSLIVAGIVLLVWVYGTARMRTLPLRNVGVVAVVQPNIGAKRKWDRAAQDSAVISLITTSRRVIYESKPDLVVWPEVALPDFRQDRLHWYAWALDLSVETGTPVLAGGLDRDGAGRRFNAAFLFDAPRRSAHAPTYHKRHLVPGIEWVPGGARRNLPLGDYTRGDSGVVYFVGMMALSPNVRFEATFENVIREDRVRGATIAINLSNDAWFAGTTGPWQSSAHLVLRAIENRIGVVRAANTGPSMVIRPDGTVEATTAYGVEATLMARVSTATGLTPYTLIGDWAGPLALGYTALLLGLASRRPRRASSGEVGRADMVGTLTLP
jgi:apolipoprotein N-acyltransferase